MKWEEPTNNRSGFTIVEVVIVLAITGLILVGAVVGISSSLERHRYNDAVQTTAQTIRSQYDYVSRVKIDSREESENVACNYISGNNATSQSDVQRGRTDCNVYGVAVILGAQNGQLVQTTTLLGKDLVAHRNDLKAQNAQIQTIADVDAYLSEKTNLELLGELKVSNYYGTQTSDSHGDITMSNCQLTELLTHENLLWGASLENPNGTPAKYIILIVRSPRDGTVHTYYKDISSIDDVIDYANADLTSCNFQNSDEDIYETLQQDADSFSAGEITLCVSSEDGDTSYGVRRTIKIAADGHGSSAVELVDFDDDSADNICSQCDDGSTDPRCN